MRIFAALTCALFAWIPVQAVELIVGDGSESRLARPSDHALRAAMFDRGTWFVLDAEISTVNKAYVVDDGQPLVFSRHIMDGPRAT
jgi:hypothetical protein